MQRGDTVCRIGRCKSESAALPRRGRIGISAEGKGGFLLAVGGGSVIDTAKAIALGLANNGEYWKFYCGEPAEKNCASRNN